MQCGQDVLANLHANRDLVADRHTYRSVNHVGRRKATNLIVISDLCHRSRNDVEHQHGGATEEFGVGKFLGLGTQICRKNIGQLHKAIQQKADVPKSADGKRITLSVDHIVKLFTRRKIQLDAAMLDPLAKRCPAIRKGKRCRGTVLDGKAERDPLVANQLSCSLIKL